MKKRRNSLILKIAILSFAVYIVATLIYQAVQIKESNKRLAQVKSQYAATQAENEKLEALLNESDEEFMESVAREELGYSKPNERIYVDASGN